MAKPEDYELTQRDRDIVYVVVIVLWIIGWLWLIPRLQ
jgi:hypothetical protein